MRVVKESLHDYLKARMQRTPRALRAASSPSGARLYPTTFHEESMQKREGLS